MDQENGLAEKERENAREQMKKAWTLTIVWGGCGQIKWEKSLRFATTVPQDHRTLLISCYRGKWVQWLPVAPSLVTEVYPCITHPAMNSGKSESTTSGLALYLLSFSSALAFYICAFKLNIHVHELENASPHLSSCVKIFECWLIARHPGPGHHSHIPTPTLNTVCTKMD